ncbi:hypothetical protein F5141DRAFT_1060915 [Pisolithus sp. B1]|nr:hypothetical protein F5141DRAFT_1060915 [Pisolithus sp. B1]
MASYPALPAEDKQRYEKFDEVDAKTSEQIVEDYEREIIARKMTDPLPSGTGMDYRSSLKGCVVYRGGSSAVLVIRTSEPTPTWGVGVDAIDCTIRVYFGGQGGRQLTRRASSPPKVAETCWSGRNKCAASVLQLGQTEIAPSKLHGDRRSSYAPKERCKDGGPVMGHGYKTSEMITSSDLVHTLNILVFIRGEPVRSAL